MTIPVLTIDGPSGAGKGTVSRAVAKQLQWHYLDSGSIYRSLAIAVQHAQVALDAVEAICDIAATMDLAFELNEGLVVRLNHVDITHQLASEQTGNCASIIAAYPAVRAVLFDKQKAFKQLPGLVADGRDMGSVVFPEAPFKVYLTASAEERAKRRVKQLIEKGIDANLLQITREIEERDRRDSMRSAAPLVIPDGAYVIDSSFLTIDQVIREVTQLVH
jgi:cytidylate kinase